MRTWCARALRLDMRRSTIGETEIRGEGRPAGESAEAPAVPTGSTAGSETEAGGGHQTRGPKTLPSPVEPPGRAGKLAAPETERASAPDATDRIDQRCPQFLALWGRDTLQGQRTRRCRPTAAHFVFPRHSAQRGPRRLSFIVSQQERRRRTP